MQNTQLAQEMLVKFYDSIKDVCTLDQNPKVEGRSMLMFLSPKKHS
jgi:translation initiation factor IF-3